MLNSELDSLDERIIAELRRDGRQANTEIARRLGVSETTVRNRIQRLINEDIIQVAARVNLSRLGYGVSVTIGVLCEAGELVSVARQLAAMEEVRFLTYLSGRYDLMMAATFRSRDELFTFLTERVGKVPGILRTETLHWLRLAKRDYDFWV